VPEAKAALSEAMGKKESYIATQRLKFERERNEIKQKLNEMQSKGVSLNAKVKLTAFDFSTYGGLDGKVIFVSADTIIDKKGMSYFLVHVKTDKNYIVDKKGIKHTIIPGMQAETDIVVDNKSIMAYILKPMLK